MKAGFTPVASPSAASRRRRGKVVTYKEAREEGDAQLWAEMDKLIEPIDRLPESHAAVAAFGRDPLSRFESWTHDVEKFFDRLPSKGALPRDRLHEIEKMGLARVEITREINLHLGAAPEVLRRYNEEYIPQIAANAQNTGDPEDQLQLGDTLRRKEEMVSRITLLEATRMTSITTSQLLRQVMELPDMQAAQALFTGQLQPGLQSWRRQSAAGTVATHQPLALRCDIRIRKPLRFKPPQPV